MENWRAARARWRDFGKKSFTVIERDHFWFAGTTLPPNDHVILVSTLSKVSIFTVLYAHTCFLGL